LRLLGDTNEASAKVAIARRRACGGGANLAMSGGTSLIEHKTLLLSRLHCATEISDSVLVGEIVPGVPWIGCFEEASAQKSIILRLW